MFAIQRVVRGDILEAFAFGVAGIGIAVGIFFIRFR
jgi:hypothetical protein